MGKIFAPATALMNRLRYPLRFALITLLFLVSLGLVLYMFVSEIERQSAFSKKERQGAALLRPAAELYELASRERMLNLPATLGLELNTGEQSIQKQIETAVDKLLEAHRQYGAGLDTTEPIRRVSQAWMVAKVTPIGIGRDAMIVDFMERIEDLNAHVLNTSNIILDPDLDTYYMQDLLWEELPRAQRLLSDQTVLGYSVISKRSADAEEKATLAAQTGLVNDILENAQKDVTVASANNPAGNVGPALISPYNEYTQTIAFYSNLISEQLIEAPNVMIPQDTLLTASADALAGSRKLFDAGIGPFDTLLGLRIEGFEARRNLALGVATGLILLVIYMWVGFYMSVRNTARSLEKASHLLESGHVDDEVVLEGKDELSRVAAATFKRISEQAKSLNSAMSERTSELTEVAAVLAHHHDGIVITDERGVVKVLNGSASRLLHTNFDAAVGQPLTGLTGDPNVGELLRAALQLPGHQHTVDTMANGRIVAVGATFVPVSEGKHSGLVTLQDVTELRKLQHLQQASMAAVTR